MRIRHAEENNYLKFKKTANAIDEVKKNIEAPVVTETVADANTEALTEDVVEISEDARKSLSSELDDMKSRYQTLSEELERAREQGEGMAEMMKEKIMCLRIAMRIISGNEVPKKDHKYLMDKDPELYAKANMMKLQNKDSRKLDRVTEDEEDEKKAEEKTGRGPSSSVESTDTQPEGCAEAPAAAEVGEPTE